jgi:hypothetical protein
MVAIDWGPVAVWFGGLATLLVAVTALVVAAGGFDWFRRPRLRISFEQGEPWCREVDLSPTEKALWIRVGVENLGSQPARGCVGRLTRVATDGSPRSDVDPVQLPWAGVPRSRSFEPLDLRRGQREFLDVLCLQYGSPWRIVTFADADFEPGFTTQLPENQDHQVTVAVFSDNAATTITTLTAKHHPDQGETNSQPLAR